MGIRGILQCSPFFSVNTTNWRLNFPVQESQPRLSESYCVFMHSLLKWKFSASFSSKERVDKTAFKPHASSVILKISWKLCPLLLMPISLVAPLCLRRCNSVAFHDKEQDPRYAISQMSAGISKFQKTVSTKAYLPLSWSRMKALFNVDANCKSTCCTFHWKHFLSVGGLGLTWILVEWLLMLCKSYCE